MIATTIVVATVVDARSVPLLELALVQLAERVAANAPLTNFAVLQALPMIAEANPQTGLLMESLMATVAQSDKEAKKRIRAFLDRKTAKVKPT